MWKIYTRKGDTGLTTTLNNTKISKNSSTIKLQGGLDEINSSIGFLRSLLLQDRILHTEINDDLKDIQNHLFHIGSDISSNLNKNSITTNNISFLESKIDYMTGSSPDINGFVFCSGTSVASYSHVVRSIIRRVEILFIEFLEDNNIESYPLSYSYINRLSDYFFSLARYINFIDGFNEEIY